MAGKCAEGPGISGPPLWGSGRANPAKKYWSGKEGGAEGPGAATYREGKLEPTVPKRSGGAGTVATRAPGTGSGTEPSTAMESLSAARRDPLNEGYFGRWRWLGRGSLEWHG